MFRRAARLAARHASLHLTLRAKGREMSAHGVTLAIAELRMRGNQVQIQGRITCEAGASSGPCSLQLCRGDEIHPIPLRGELATQTFALDLPWSPLRHELALELPEGQQLRLGFAAFSRNRLRLAKLAMMPGLGRRAIRALPTALQYRRTGDLALRRILAEELGLIVPERVHQLDPALFETVFAAVAARPLPTGPLMIAVPIHGGRELLAEVLERVVVGTDLPWHLVLIEDCSPGEQMRPWLRAWVRATEARIAAEGLPGRITLIENERNLGFIGSTNRGMELALAEGLPLVLLNSDALVPMGWASRLLAPFADPGVASVTPMSNDAELMSVPVICQRHDMVAGEADAIDAYAREFVPDAGNGIMPTGVGYCMAIAPHWLQRVGLLDTVFGRGYGEEVDWCQRAVALGGRHIGLANLFVEHRGGASFGSEAKMALIRANGEVISRRYPRFDLDVQEYIGADPMLTARLALGIAGLAARLAPGDMPDVTVAHSMGGGADLWLQRKIRAEIAQRGASLVLRVGGAMRWRLELHAEGGVSAASTEDRALVARLLAVLPALRLDYSCGVGDRDPAGLPGELLALLRPEDRLSVEIHDFFPLSPSFTLLGADGLFHGVPQTDTTDPAHVWRGAGGREVGLAEWRKAWGALMARAEAVRAFSHDSRAHVLAAWPELTERVVVHPHALQDMPAPIMAPKAGARPVLAIAGHLNRQKGGEVVAQLSGLLRVSALLSKADLPRIIVLGKVDPILSLPPEIEVHGGYEHDQMGALAARLGVSAWLMPAVWPETFSYAVHEALATGLPVFCLNVGAQAEALRKAGQAENIVPLVPDVAGQAQALAVRIARHVQR